MKQFTIRCFGFVFMPTWQHDGSANPDSGMAEETLALKPHGLVVNSEVVRRHFEPGWYYPRGLASGQYPCALWVLSSMSLMCCVS